VVKLEFFCNFISAVLVWYYLSNVTTKRLDFVIMGTGKNIIRKRLDFIIMGAAENISNFHVQRNFESNYVRVQVINPPYSSV
jgi:hypothetical protein